jgi:hypothetical protein
LNRRRFLKYAGATAAIAGGSVLGLDYIARPRVPPVVSQTASGYSSSALPITSVTKVPTTTATSLATTRTSTTETGPVLVWQSDFANGTLDGFEGVDIDPAVRCDEFPPERADVEAAVVDDATAPTGMMKALELRSNVRKRRGVVAYALTFRHSQFEDNRNWYAYGHVRKAEGQFQAIAVNMQLVEDYKDVPCLFTWHLNPYDPQYGYVTLFRGLDANKQGIWEPVHEAGDDMNWHYWEIEGHYAQNPKVRKVVRMRIDDHNYSLNIDLPRINNPFINWPESFGVLLETVNMWNCQAGKVTSCASHWTKIGLVRVNR